MRYNSRKIKIFCNYINGFTFSQVKGPQKYDEKNEQEDKKENFSSNRVTLENKLILKCIKEKQENRNIHKINFKIFIEKYIENINCFHLNQNFLESFLLCK